MSDIIIPLNHGQVTVIDRAFEVLATLVYGAVLDDENLKYYALRTGRRLTGGRTTFYLARDIMSLAGQPPGELFVDHINGDTLDNRLSNLRLADNSENLCNRGKPRNNTSGFKGVTQTRHGKYRAKIEHHKKAIHLGLFVAAEDAARAYDLKAIELHGSFARINFPVQP